MRQLSIVVQLCLSTLHCRSLSSRSNYQVTQGPRKDDWRESRTRNLEPGARDQEPGTRNQEPGTRNQEPGTRNQEPELERELERERERKRASERESSLSLSLSLSLPAPHPSPKAPYQPQAGLIGYIWISMDLLVQPALQQPTKLHLGVSFVGWRQR